MKDNAIIANLCSFPDDNSHAVINNQALTNARSRMDLNPSEPTSQLTHQS
jgi:hypothetical protein